MINTELLRLEIKNKGLKLGYIAESLGISAYGLALKIKGESDFRAKEIAALCKLLEIEDLEKKEEIFFGN